MKKSIIIIMAVATTLAASCKCNSPAADTSSAVIDNIMNRKSVRSFTGEALDPAQIETLLKAAMAAPTAMNQQPWQFVVLDQESAAKVFADDRRPEMFSSAGAVIIVCGETSFERVPRDSPDAAPVKMENQFWFEDCGAATENLLLAAAGLGLGAVWISCYPIQHKIDKMASALGIPEGVLPFAIVPVGYPAGDDQPKDKWKPEKIHYNRW